jgi:predicted metal-binding membrane protein
MSGSSSTCVIDQSIGASRSVGNATESEFGVGRVRAAMSVWGASLTSTLGIAAAGWVIAIREMSRMDMGVASRLGSFTFFVALWAAMMAAMMLPGAVPAVVRRAHDGGGAGVAPVFVASYLAVWTLVGIPIYVAYRPHGTVVAGAVTIAAGLYELTPLKAHFRGRCHERTHSGLGFGMYCVGSSIGLMLIVVAVSVMSIRWMAVIAAIALAQKLLPTKPAFDVPLALAIIGFGILMVVAPTWVPGLTPSM